MVWLIFLFSIVICSSPLSAKFICFYLILMRYLYAAWTLPATPRWVSAPPACPHPSVRLARCNRLLRHRASLVLTLL